jgi:hypothetical protein
MLEKVKYDATPQPLPVGGTIDVAIEVAKDLKAMGLENIAECVEARIRLGEKKYGTRLKAHNGRDAMTDLFEELLDALNYSKQIQLESTNGDTYFYPELLKLVIKVKASLDLKHSTKVE